MKYLFDNCLSYRYAEMLRALDIDAVAVRDEYSEDISDIELFGKLKGQRLVFVTTDARQRTRKAEAAALRECGVTALFLGPFWAKLGFWKGAIWIVTRWPAIQGFAEPVALGTCAEVSQRGRIQPFMLRS